MSDKIKLFICMAFMGIGSLGFPSISLKAQSHEATQLILNYEKLVQLRQILDDMYEGYSVLNEGYSKVKSIAEGNFKLHEAFLNELLKVSPEVRNYYRVAEIIIYQQRILQEYLITYNQVKNDRVFTVGELANLHDVYRGMFRGSLRNLDELTLILTAGELRMSDFDRLEAIDRLHSEMVGILVEVRQVNASVNTLFRQRKRMDNERKAMESLNGINP